jgi:hypothetical protein
MRAMKLTAALFALFLAAPALLAQNPAVRIHAATVLDGTGKTLRNATIVVQGSKSRRSTPAPRRMRPTSSDRSPCCPG